LATFFTRFKPNRKGLALDERRVKEITLYADK
jgi:hypothetical protein